MITEEQDMKSNTPDGAMPTFRYPMLRSKSALSTGKTRHIRRLLNHQTPVYDEEARLLLRKIVPEGRDAEWYFLAGCLQHRRGHMIDAQAYMDRACEMGGDQVPEYREVYEKILSSATDADETEQEGNESPANGQKLTGAWNFIQDGCCECCCEACGTVACECICESIGGCG